MAAHDPFSTKTRWASAEPPSAFPPVLYPGTDAADAAAAVHRSLLGTLVATWEGVVDSRDLEDLHQFRVALRRTRTALSQLRGVFPEDEEAHFSSEFKWVASRTGPARDLDVFLESLPSYRDALGPGRPQDLAPLVQVLQAQRAQEQLRLRAGLKCRRFQRLASRWAAFLNGPQDTVRKGPLGDHPIQDVASRRIHVALHRLLRRGNGLGPDPPPPTLHRLRIDGKKARYLLTLFRSLFPEGQVSALIEELKGVQNCLGRYHDYHLQEEILRNLAGDSGSRPAWPSRHRSASDTFLLGRLMAHLAQRRAEELMELHRRFRRFTRPGNLAGFQRLFPGQPPGPAFPGHRHPLSCLESTLHTGRIARADPQSTKTEGRQE